MPIFSGALRVNHTRVTHTKEDEEEYKIYKISEMAT